MSCLSNRNTEGQSDGCSSFNSKERKDAMEGTMVQRIGNVLYTVHVRPAENAKDNYDTKLRKIIEQAMIVSLNDEERKCS